MISMIGRVAGWRASDVPLHAMGGLLLVWSRPYCRCSSLAWLKQDPTSHGTLTTAPAHQEEHQMIATEQFELPQDLPQRSHPSPMRRLGCPTRVPPAACKVSVFSSASLSRGPLLFARSNSSVDLDCWTPFWILRDATKSMTHQSPTGTPGGGESGAGS